MERVVQPCFFSGGGEDPLSHPGSCFSCVPETPPPRIRHTYLKPQKPNRTIALNFFVGVCVCVRAHVCVVPSSALSVFSSLPAPFLFCYISSQGTAGEAAALIDLLIPVGDHAGAEGISVQSHGGVLLPSHCFALVFLKQFF
ncbi:Hypothetical predicted protein [Podarcis lilfordi]|uniref:Uncharacterized protein n=1 Tax=Podarcis lilfordi TaxID=74358 RepID=A0AA35PE73_9SAUR|nr:Hypothetical predicted protein [Podarcis lilfordi]